MSFEHADILQRMDKKKFKKIVTAVCFWSIGLEFLFFVFGLTIPQLYALWFALSFIVFIPALAGYVLLSKKLGTMLDIQFQALLSKFRPDLFINSKRNRDIYFFQYFLYIIPVIFYVAFGLASNVYRYRTYEERIFSSEFAVLFWGMIFASLVALTLKLIFGFRSLPADISRKLLDLGASMGISEVTEDGLKFPVGKRIYFLNDFLFGISIKTENPFGRYISLTLLDVEILTQEVGEECASKIVSFRANIRDMDFDADWFRVILRSMDAAAVQTTVELMECMILYLEKKHLDHNV